MGLFKSLGKAVIGIVALPVDLTADALTLGGVLTDQRKPYTAQRAEKIMENLDDATRPEED